MRNDAGVIVFGFFGPRAGWPKRAWRVECSEELVFLFWLFVVEIILFKDLT